ncbi:60S ribosomal protein L14 [Chamberlinius hualienensis]
MGVHNQPYTKFVEVGRVAYAAFGKEEGKIFVIIDIIDQNRALIDGPCSGVKRQAYPFKQMHLTKFKIDIQHSCGYGVVKKAWETANISEKWAESTWAKRLEAKKLRDNLNDFDRFKLGLAKKARNKTIRTEYNKLKRKEKKLREKPKPKTMKAPKPKPTPAPKAAPKTKPTKKAEAKK